MVQLEVEYYKVRIFAAIGAFSLWLQLFFWFRLFDSLAQYVDLIFETIKDIKNFMIVLGCIMAMNGSALYLIQINSLNSGNEDDYVYEYGR